MREGSQALQEFGARVRNLRRRRALSQEGLAENVGLHRTYIGSVERGERNISLVNILRIADELDADAGELIAGLSL
jgi:transcriptional regulator with XRE-family HTH domain